MDKIIGGILVLIIGGIIVYVNSVSDTNASIPNTISCNTTLSVSGGLNNATETSRFGPHRDWVAARSAMADRVRTEAQDDAKTSLDDQFDDVECPEECPTLTKLGQPSYNTSVSITGSNGWGWIRYDAQASSQASQKFQCK